MTRLGNLETRRQEVVDDIRGVIDEAIKQCERWGADETEVERAQRYMVRARELTDGLEDIERLPRDHPLFTKTIVVSCSVWYETLKNDILTVCADTTVDIQHPLREELAEIIEDFFGDDGLLRQAVARVRQLGVDGELRDFVMREVSSVAPNPA